jgi:hypothetical protein
MATIATLDDDLTTPEEEPALKRSKPDEDSCPEKNQQQHQGTTTKNNSNLTNKKSSNDAKRLEDDEVLDDLLATWKGAETEAEKVKALQELINIYGSRMVAQHWTGSYSSVLDFGLPTGTTPPTAQIQG